MTDIPVSGYLSDAARTEAQQKQAFEDQRDFITQSPGGNPTTELTISAGAVTATHGTHSIDTQSDAATDDLDTIAQTNLPDGSLLYVYPEDDARTVVVTNGAGGAGQIFTQDAADFSMTDSTMAILLRRDGAAWYEVFRAYGKSKAAARSNLGVNAWGGFKNLIINGDMRIAQRGEGTTIVASFASTTTAYGPDRFCMSGSGSPQNRGDGIHTQTGGPAEFPNYIRYDVTTAEAAVGAAEYTGIEYRIEAQDLIHLKFGDASAKTTNLQFRFRSPKTGTHCVTFYQVDGARHYIREFTVNAANTWETHSVTYPGDASGQIDDDNGLGVRIIWPIIAGTDFQNTVDTWAAGADFATSGQQNLADNVANNIDITGVQLEVVEDDATEGTDFEHRPIGVELALCQRYYWQPINTTIQHPGMTGWRFDTSSANITVNFPVEMRIAEPTITATSMEAVITDGSGGQNTPNISAAAWVNTNQGMGGLVDFTHTVQAIGNDGDGVHLRSESAGSPVLSFDAEL